MSKQELERVRLYKNHGKSIGIWEGWVESNDPSEGVVVIRYGKKPDGQLVERRYEAEPKNVGRSNETSACKQAVLELKSRFRNQLKKGYVLTVEEARFPATNSLGLTRPMKGISLQEVKPEIIDWENAFVQPKLDGHRALHQGELYSTGGNPIYLPHIKEGIEQLGLGGLHLDGEIYCHGLLLQEISRLVKKPRPETVSLSYYLFDIVDNSPFEDRYRKLSQYFQEENLHSSIKLVPTFRVTNMEQVMEHHVLFREQGYEGTMLRHGRIEYRGGKRVNTLLKMKEFQDAEFRIIAVERGKPNTLQGNYYEVPVWVCRVGEDKTFTVTAQGDAGQKHELWEERTSHIGKYLTVKYHYLSSDGIPQLPVALRFREDL